MKLRKLEVIFKTIERCNLNCSYCYFFHGADQSYKKHPVSVPWEVIERLSLFLKEAIHQFKIDVVQLDLHGGEPTLQNKSTFDKMCDFFYDQISPLTHFQIAIQTNATLIDDEWIELFSKHKISVGVSIDGPKTVHDKFRIDFKGKGSYDKVVKGIEKLQNAEKAGKLGGVGLLCVINPNNNAAELYEHFVYDLKIKYMDFLLPDYTHDTFKDENPESYGKFLCDLFNRWIQDDDTQIRIRYLNSFLQLMLGKNTALQGLGPRQQDMLAITISSNGDISPDDSLRSGITNCMNKFNISTTSFSQFFNSPIIQNLFQAEATLPQGCRSCCWEKVCCGGRLLHRFSQHNHFDNPSIYCSGLKTFYSAIIHYLLMNGISTENIKETLAV